MKKDIEMPETKDVLLAIIPGLLDSEQWEVVLINNSEQGLKNVLVNSSGFGTNSEGDKIQTGVLRHFFEAIPSLSFQSIELIDPSVFIINNEYWVSFWLEEKLYDRRFLFVPESISEKHLVYSEMLGKKAVVHA